MSDEEDYNSEEDEDYVPIEGEQVSEEEYSGDEEDLSSLHDGDGTPQTGGKKRKSGSGARKKDVINGRKRRGGIKLDTSANGGVTEEHTDNQEQTESEEEKKRKKELAEQIAKEEEEKKVEKEKKRADDLWASFMSDVKKPPAKTPSSGLGLSSASVGTASASVKPKTENKSVTDSTSCTPSKGEVEKTEKVTITKVFDFAGEEVKITKEVDVNSKEAKAEQKKQEEAQQALSVKISTPSTILGASLGIGEKRPAVGGLGSVLQKINKKTKMGTLEKSKIDWDSFKKKEGINDDLKIHNKGKQGYMERMAFLNRADQRQYEIERDLRLGTSSKR